MPATDHDRTDPRPRQIALVVVSICSAALFLTLAWPLINGHVYVFDDLANFHLPVRYLYANALAAGDSILWTPALFAGFYLHGEGQAGMFHPLHWLLYRSLPLPWAFNLEFLLSYAAAFSGMFVFLHRLRLTREAAVCGAMLFAFGGFQLLHFHHLNVIAITAHLPWLLAAIDALLRADLARQRARAYIAVAAVVASEVLLGFPQAVWWNVLAASAYALLHVRSGAHIPRLLACAIAGLTGVFIGGIQLLPTLDVAATSTRAASPVAGFALSYSLHPYNLLQFWSPYAIGGRVYSWADYPQIHELGVYAGSLPLLAPLWLWLRRDALGAHRRLAFATAIFALGMLVLAMGRYGGLAVLLTHVPGLASLRAPARYIVLTQFAMTLLSALAIDDLVRRGDGPVVPERRNHAMLWVPALLSLATTATFNTHALAFAPRLQPAALASAAVGTVIVIATTVAFVAATRTRRAIPALVVIAAMDLGCWGFTYIWKTRPRSIESLTSVMPEAVAGVRYDWPDEWRDRPILKGHWLAWGYAGLFPSTTLRTDSELYLRLAGVRGRIRADAVAVPFADPVPRAALHGDPRGSALVVTDRPGHIVVQTTTSVPQQLSLTERFHEGWTATADGDVPLTVSAFAGDFIACAAPPGTHRIEFRFMPRSFRRGALISTIGLFALIVGAAVIGRGRRGGSVREQEYTRPTC